MEIGDFYRFVSFCCPIRYGVKLANKDWCLNSRILNTVEKSGQVSLDPGFLTVFVLTFIIYLLELGTGNWKMENGNCELILLVRDGVKLANKDWCLNSRILSTKGNPAK